MLSVSVDAQGSLLKVSVHRDDDGFRPIAKRGVIGGFSQNSRMRMLRMLARLRVDTLAGYRSQTTFLTLTTGAMLHPRLAKRCLQIWLKRLRREYPTVAAVWRMEYQKRGAAHFHLIMFNTPWLKKEWVEESWGAVIGEAKPFTQVRRVYQARHMMSYAAKYCAKVAGISSGFNNASYLTAVNNIDDVVCESPGRVWGYYNKAGLPFAHALSCDLDVGAAWQPIRAYCRMFWEWLPDWNDLGFTVFCDDPYHALTHIRKINKLFG